MLGHWNLLESFDQVLRSVPPPASAGHIGLDRRRRSLDQSSYLKTFLFGLFNPVVRTLRGLSAASLLPRVQEEVCGRYIRLSAFSEMQHVVQPEWLERVFGELSRQSIAQGQQEDPRAMEQWLAQDGSVFTALPRMTWALYGVGPKGEAKGVRLHLTFNLVEAKPQEVQVTPAIACERKVWREKWKRGQAYVGDRHFAQDYKVFKQLNIRDCSFVFRLKDNISVMEVEEELAVSPNDRARGIVRQAWVRLGAVDKYRSDRVRVIWVESKLKGSMILITNLTEEKASAELVLQIYRWRWQIELFFRWIKCVLGCDHWFAESPNGAKIQLYLALIAALLFQLHFGVRPNRRIMELLQFYFFGIASPEDLSQGLIRELGNIAKAKKR